MPDNDTLALARPDAALENVERQIAALGMALRERDAEAIEKYSAELQRVLVLANQRFTRFTRQPGEMPSMLRERLARAAGQISAQRESLARAGASLERAFEVLMPPAEAPGVYGQGGHAERKSSSACIDA